MNGSFGFTEMIDFGENNNTVLNFNATIINDNDDGDYESYDPGAESNPYVTHMFALKYMQQGVSIFGMIANVLNITVLTRKNMKSPIYAILLSLAVADIIVLSSEMFINFTDFPLVSFCNYYYVCAVAIRVCDELNVISHLASAWLTVVVAVWRIMSVSYPVLTEQWRSPERAKAAIVSTYAACTLLELPRMWFYHVETAKDKDVFFYRIIQNDAFLKRWSGWVGPFQIVFTVVRISSSVLLTLLTLGLMWSLYKANKKRKTLKMSSKGDDSFDRTTNMLIVVVVIFLLTNVPRALKYPINKLIYDVYLSMLIDEVFYFLTAVNSSVNFTVYYVMSSEFRETFVSIFLTRCKFKLSDA